MSNMVKALDEVGIDEPARSALLGLFERSSAYVVNVGETPAVDGDSLNPEIARRWDTQLRLDEAVGAVRAGESHRAIALAEGCDSAVKAGLLALMIASGDGQIVAYVRDTVTAYPALVQERYAGRTLLHGASAAGDLTTVELLLRLGADPMPPMGAGTRRFIRWAMSARSQAREMWCGPWFAAGRRWMRTLGVKQCTALHMAARRGSVDAATALLDCGADIEARDSLGETPLRHAVNCDKTGVASLLLSRGADVNAKGSKGLTPLRAARSSAMKQILQSRSRR